MPLYAEDAQTADATPLEVSRASEIARQVLDNVARVVHAERETLGLCVMALLGEGHVIIEDAPGVGKTMLARSLARSVDCRFARVQFTPDLLPSDVTGASVYDQRANAFEFRPGPVFSNVLLVDEINRASPRTQSALLECMQEAQVTVDGVSHPLERPFMVVATQNPIEYEGTFPLPEAQLDRFSLRLRLGYPPLPDEARMLAEQTAAAGPPLDDLEPVCDAADVRGAIAATRDVAIDDSLHRYVVALLRATRDEPRLALGASPRAGIALVRVARARALLEGRDYLLPDDVKTIAPAVLSHRLILSPEARADGLSGDDVVAAALARTPVPV